MYEKTEFKWLLEPQPWETKVSVPEKQCYLVAIHNTPEPTQYI